MHATSLNCLLLLAQLAASVSFSTPYSRIAVLRPSGWDLFVLLVRLPPPNSIRIHVSLTPALDAPCKVEDIPAVDAIVLSVCFPFRCTI
jgi:hypothetical protein